MLGAVCLFVFAIPWQNAISLPGIGTFARISGFIMIGVYLIHLATSSQRRLPWEFLLLFGYIGWYALSGFWAEDPPVYASRLFQFIQLLAAILVIWQAAKTERSIRAIMVSYLIGGYILAFIAIKEFRKLQVEDALGGSRVTLEGFNANGVAIMLALGLPMALYLYSMTSSDSSFRSRLGRAFPLLYIVLAAFGMVLVASRGGLLVGLLGISICGWHMFRKSELRPRAMNLTAFFVGAVGLFIAFGPTEGLVGNIDRLASTANSLKKQDLNHRQDIWKDGIPLIMDHPVLGVGGASFAQALKARHGMKYPAHNVYISTLAELGIVGFVLYFGYIGLVFRAVRRSANPHRYFSIALLMAVLAALATANLEAGKQIWLIFALTLAHAKLYPAAQPEQSAPLLASSPHPAA